MKRIDCYLYTPSPFPGDAREGEGDAGDGGEGEDGQEEQLPGEGQGGQGTPQHLSTQEDKYLYFNYLLAQSILGRIFLI